MSVLDRRSNMKRKYKITVRVSDIEYAEASVAADLLDIPLSQVVRAALRRLVMDARAKGGYYGGRPISGSRVQALWDFLVSEACSESTDGPAGVAAPARPDPNL